jgi:uncharacterized protein (TIGR02246 family)
VDAAQLKEFATRYTAAWCSQNPASVASFFAKDGSLTINNGSPSIGRTAITAAAQGFMTAFPDLDVAMNDVTVNAGRAIYRWTLAGTNTGPGGTCRLSESAGTRNGRSVPTISSRSPKDISTKPSTNAS